MKLRTKISLLTTVIAVSVVFFTLLPIRGVIVNAFRQELEKKGVSLAGILADRIANHLLLKDRFQTSKAFSEVLSKEKDIEYLFATDVEGMMFAHTFGDSAPPGIMDWNPLSDKPSHVQLLDTEKGYIRDVAVSVVPGTKSELHLGIREDSLRKTLGRMRILTVPIIFFVIALGAIASLLFSRVITEPLNKFVEFTKVLGRGEFGKRVDVKYGDEIGYLARNFNTLSMRLKSTKDKMEEAFTYTRLLEAEKLSSIGQISAGLAHELKNPITTLKMLFQAFKEQPDMTKEDAEVISNEIEKIDAVLTNFIGFVKEKSLRKTDVDLSRLVDRVTELAAYSMEKARITMHKDLIETLPVITADSSMLEHVFLNLVMNAFDAMPDGGEIRISGKSDGRFVEVMVWDRGTGIPPDIRAKIFDPFFTTKTEGTGLGLSIAYNIVRSHGGSLLCSSTEGSGTVFTVRLPIGKNGHGEDSGR